MGGRVISLIDYRELRLAGSVRETAKGRYFRVNLKNASHMRSMKTRQRLVGSHVDSIDRVRVLSAFSGTNLSPKWSSDYRFVVPAAFFLICLVLVAFGL
jgi:hypothetical protein